MSALSARIPSVNVPFVDAKGRITPVWHEFLRTFISASVTVETGETAPGDNIVAAAGLVETEDDDTGDRNFSVGAGNGLAVNANDVSIDISGQSAAAVALDDEVLISDVSDNNSIRKTSVRAIGNIVGSVPGGVNTNVQYNDNGFFGGDPNFFTDGGGSVDIIGDLSVDNVNINGNTISSTNADGNIVLDPAGTGYIDVNSDMRIVDSNGDLVVSGATFSTESSSDKFLFTVPAGSAAAHYIFTQSGAGSSDMPFNIECLRASAELNLENNSESSGSTLQESRLRFLSEGTVNWCLGLTSESDGRNFTFGTTALNAGNVYTIDATNRYFTHQTSVMKTTTAGITASTTQTQGQGALTADVNEVATCANANDTVTLPAAVAGRMCLVINNGAQTLQIFPASGDNLGAGVDTSTTTATATRKLFWAFDTTNWEPVI